MKFLVDWYHAYLRKRLEQKLLADQGFVTRCKCGEFLNVDPVFKAIRDGIYVYKCRSCGTCATFDFIHYPLPVKVENETIS